ncbi:C-type lectin domain family 4 member K-like isoform X2 [Ornithorhynchus anatinus]|uniref:C-type lectin domain-containing protein n=1 Tax=Ornithorhynchus anatinus TaxID=9258 RepID=A0A6I8PH22_ORNAN|nr:C-type lectin domain family 4 member K-like isoform X2 [Ornithorhynchus anatinus]
MARDYENISFGQVSHVHDPTSTAGRPAAHKSLRVACAALIMLAVVLLSSLIVVTVLYLQNQRCLWDSESYRSAANISTLKSEMEKLQGHLETTRASLTTLKEQYGNFVKKISQNWRFHAGNLYFFSMDSRTWGEAEKFCVSEDSHLASVTSVEEQTFLFSTPNQVRHWIGLSDQVVEGQWRWTDGTIYSDAENKRFWKENEPNNQGNAEHCVHLWEKAEKSWNDERCERNFQFICKWVPKPSGR